MLAFFAPLVAAISLQVALDARASSAPGTGIALGIIDHGVQKVYVAGNDGNGRAVNEQTVFEIGSVTKTFTATALAAMTLRGQVRLNDPIAKFLPAGIHAPSKDGKPITLLDLAEQRSGLPRLPSNMDDALGDNPYAGYTNAQMYEFLNGYRLTRDPGAAYEYSNYAVGLLGQLLANRAGTSYAQLLNATVLDPLGMSQTAVIAPGVADPPLLAAGHDLTGDAVTTWQFQSIAPAGGIASSLEDMLKYLRCNMGQGPLAKACLFAQRPRATGQPRHQIGLIWNVDSTTGTISHGGDTFGFHAFVGISRDRQTGVVVLSNGPVVTDIATHVLSPAYPIEVCPASVPVSEANPASYEGTYCNQTGGLTFVVQPAAKPDALSIALLPQPATTVPRIAPDLFYAAAYDARFKFVRNGADIVGLWLTQYGQSIPAIRLNSSGKPVIPQLPPRFPPVVPLDPTKLEQYAGTYDATGVGTFTVTLRSGGLYVQLSGQPAAPVFASATDQFFYKVVDAQIQFNRDAAGNVTSLTLHQGGQTITAVRTRP